MAADTQDKEPKQGVLASLKGVWRKVAGSRPSGSGAAESPAPVELQTSVDEAPAAAPAAAPAPVVAEATPAPVEEAAAPSEAPAAEAPVESAAKPDAVPAPENESEPVSEPLEVAAPATATPKKAAKRVPAQDPVVGESTPALGGASSPFIAPATTEAGPDSSWTVAQLRSLAKERGVRGYSSMSKSQLLGSLGNPQA